MGLIVLGVVSILGASTAVVVGIATRLANLLEWQFLLLVGVEKVIFLLVRTIKVNFERGL